MADESLDQDLPELDTVSSEEDKAEAKKLGWSDRDKWRGKAEDWIPAKEFNDRGKHIIPIMRENNARLQRELEAERAERAKLEGRLSAQEEATVALQEFYAEETNRRVEEVRKQLKAAIKEASAEGDHETVADLTQESVKLEAEVAARAADAEKAKGEKKAPPADEQPQVDPRYLAWRAGNPEWQALEASPLTAHRALSIMQELRLDPANAGLIAEPFWDRAWEIYQERFGEAPRRESKVGAPRGGSRERSNGKSFASLPADAQRAAHDPRFTNKFVGEGKLYKTLADWEKQYAADYYAGEAR